jgi:hypothetical protein
VIRNVHHLTLTSQSPVIAIAMTTVVTVRFAMRLGSVCLIPSANAQKFNPTQSLLLKIRILLLCQTAAGLMAAAIPIPTPQLSGLQDLLPKARCQYLMKPLHPFTKKGVAALRNTSQALQRSISVTARVTLNTSVYSPSLKPPVQVTP